MGGESALPNETKLLPPPAPPPQLKSIKPNLKADTEEHLRLPRYFISQKELNSEAHTHRTAREGGDQGWPKARFFLPALHPRLRPAAERGPGGSVAGLVPQEGRGWLPSSREEAAGSGSILTAWPSAKRRIRGPAGQCAASPATRDMGLSCIPVCLVGEPTPRQDAAWGDAGSPPLLPPCCASSLLQRGAGGWERLSPGPWQWYQALNIPSWLWTDPTVGCQGGGTRQRLGLSADGMEKRVWRGLKGSEAAQYGRRPLRSPRAQHGPCSGGDVADGWWEEGAQGS